MHTQKIFETEPVFCADCGSILPSFREIGDLKCYSCKKTYPITVFSDSCLEYTIHFNSVEACEKIEKDEQKRREAQDDGDEGPVVERKCPKCGNDKMSYATLQLRSADEGQTVFYTCTKCKHKETENS